MNASPLAGRCLRILLLLATATLLLAACGGSSDDDADESGAPVEAAATTAGAAAVDDASRTIAPSAGEEDGAGVAAEEPVSSGGAAVAQENWNQYIIRTASISLSVGDVGQAMAWVRDTAIAKGGYVFSSSSYLDGDRQFASLTIQVPVDQFDATMNDLRSGALVDEVEREESSSQDVSAEWVDNESRLAALRETQARFLELLGRADTVDDILRLEYELQNVRAQIEQIQGRQNYLEQQTSFSTISVSLAPVGAAVPDDPTPSEGFSLSAIFERAWEHSRGAIEGLLVATITVAIVALAIVPLALLAFVVWRVVRRVNARSAAA